MKVSDETEERCSQPSGVVGPCKAGFPRWTFSVSIQKTHIIKRSVAHLKTTLFFSVHRQLYR